MGVDERFQPDKIDVAREDGLLTITYLDGYVARFDLTTLRSECPCATCRGLRDRGERAWPRPTSPTPLRLVDAHLHGAWGLLLVWNDGHATGIFPFESLRHFHEDGTGFRPDSGLSRPEA